MVRDRVIDGQAASGEEERFNESLRPERLDDCIGQKDEKPAGPGGAHGHG